MNTTTIIVGIVLLALIALYFYNRNRPAPRGTYDDKRSRSGGSIGGGNHTADDPNVRSSGSIGGGVRGHDSPNYQSGGSIGGGPQSENSHAPRRVDPEAHVPTRQAPTTRRDNEPVVSSVSERHSTLPPLTIPRENNTEAAELAQQADEQRRRAEAEAKQKGEFHSGGSFGGSRR